MERLAQCIDPVVHRIVGAGRMTVKPKAAHGQVASADEQPRAAASTSKAKQNP
jgi:hypothetical protein